MAGAGNHRSSIFRLHIGAALMRKYPRLWQSITWGIGQAAGGETQEQERLLEREVSQILGAMRLLWLNVWPAPGSADTELGVLMEPEVSHGETEVYTRVQA